MARVVSLFPDLLFGSKVQGMLTAAGHGVQLAAGDAAGQVTECDVLVVDLTEDDVARIETVQALREVGAVRAGTRLLAFYLHTEVDVRKRALAANFDLVVPRSRMAREGAALVDGLVASAGTSSSRA